MIFNGAGHPGALRGVGLGHDGPWSGGCWRGHSAHRAPAARRGCTTGGHVGRGGGQDVSGARRTGNDDGVEHDALEATPSQVSEPP